MRCLSPCGVGRESNEPGRAMRWRSSSRTCGARCWGCPAVGVHESFFELGGHSLAAVRVVARLSSVLGVEIPLRPLFDAPTITGLADAARRLLARNEARRRVAIAPVPRDRPLPLWFGQSRLWFIDQAWPGTAAYNVRCSGACAVSSTHPH